MYFPGFLTPVLIQLSSRKPPTTFLTCFCRGERRKYARKKVPFNRGSNSQPPGHESDTLTTEPPGRGESQFAQLFRLSPRKWTVDVTLRNKPPNLRRNIVTVSLENLYKECGWEALSIRRKNAK